VPKKAAESRHPRLFPAAEVQMICDNLDARKKQAEMTVWGFHASL
jgi:hypothetical protein